MKKRLQRCVSLFFLLAMIVTGPFYPTSLCADSFLYSDYEILLKLSVSNGLVDRRALEENAHYLFTFLTDVHTLEKREYDRWTREEKTAFWINVYNACALSFILKYPYIEKITDVPEGPHAKIFSVFSEPISLSEIKHMYVRGYCNDERIHFALVTPAKGFPRLRNEAYLSVYINLQLEEDVIRFVQDAHNLSIDVDKKIIRLSRLFEWTAVDFVTRYNNEIPELLKFNIRERAVLKFLTLYVPQYESFIMKGDFTLEYSEFDWQINTLRKPEVL
jgi:hypothetical protein